MIDAPPLEAGAVHDTTDEPVAFADETEVAETPVGAPGGPTGTTALELLAAPPVPALFVAATKNVYETPLVRPETVHDTAGADALHVNEPGVEVTV